MKLYANKLDNHLAHHFRPIYFISGDEPLQLNECADLVRRKARELGYSGREVFVADNDFDWSQLLSAADSMSLFAELRILELRLPSGKPGREGGAALRQYAERPAEDAVLLVTSGKIDKTGQNSAWYKAIDKAGISLQVWPVSPQELPAWITRRMRGLGLRPTHDAAELIAERVEGNLLAAQQEIDKLALLYADSEINIQEVLGVVADSARYQTFDLADAALLGNAKRVVNILEGLRAERIDPVPVLIALSMHVRSATQIARIMDNGRSIDAAMREARIWKNRQNIFQQALHRHDADSWDRINLRCAQLDLACKGMVRRGNLWDELLELALCITGKMQLNDTEFSRIA
jgi:DNA polymerase-3 subunit delta